MYKLGVDLGGTKTEAILLDENLNVIARKRVQTPKNDYEQIVNNISLLVSELTENISNFSIGVCTPGAISNQTGLIKNSNTQCLIGKSIKKDLENKMGKKISIENDANCFAMAEAKMGAAIDYGLVFGVIMGTGVGGGIVIDKKLHSGRTNIAGEWGHHILHRNGNLCYCGK
ncbi:MAG: ROK family protein, partial [Nitrosopumilus sp.]|nr:ROK family protein [Nitrosopumilus sp.]